MTDSEHPEVAEDPEIQAAEAERLLDEIEAELAEIGRAIARITDDEIPPPDPPASASA